MRPIENGLSRSSTLELKIIMEIVFFFSFKLLNNVCFPIFIENNNCYYYSNNNSKIKINKQYRLDTTL